MKPRLTVLFCLGLLIPAAAAGVVVETEIRDPEQGVPLGTETFYAQGEMIRTDPAGPANERMSTIFRDQTLWFIDHGKKTGQKIDRATLSEFSQQLSEMMRQLDNMPPEQRAMMTKMMQKQMPGMRKPPVRRMDVGETIQVGDYTCTLHTLYSDGDRVQETCAADESVASAVTEVMAAFHAMSQFTTELQDMVAQLPFADMLDSAFKGIPEVEGFPIRVRWFDGEGRVVRVSTLKSIEKKDIEASSFDIPKGYKIRDLRKELQKTR